MVMASCQDSDTTKETSSTIPVDTSTTTVITTHPEPTTTTIIEVVPPPVTVPQEPILCERHSHPLHHRTCEEADAYIAAKKKTAATTITPATVVTGPRNSDHSPTPSLIYSSDSELKNCIAKWESENGRTSSNVYQFEPGTWAAYGGTGSASNASMSEQNAVFDRAWADGGEGHWAAQKGRCF